MLLLEGGTGRRVGAAPTTAAGDAKYARTINAEIGELLQVRNPDIQRLPAAHA
jgi:hypothetical protein